jgi:hypothetical protein
MNEPNWKKMYAILCGSISDALDAMPETGDTRKARETLQSALDRAEELYIQPDDPAE